MRSAAYETGWRKDDVIVEYKLDGLSTIESCPVKDRIKHHKSCAVTELHICKRSIFFVQLVVYSAPKIAVQKLLHMLLDCTACSVRIISHHLFCVAWR